MRICLKNNSRKEPPHELADTIKLLCPRRESWAPERPASGEVSVRSLAGLGVNAYCLGGYTFAGFLPTVGHPGELVRTAVAFASCLFLTSYPFGMLTPVRKSELNTGD